MRRPRGGPARAGLSILLLSLGAALPGATALAAPLPSVTDDADGSTEAPPAMDDEPAPKDSPPPPPPPSAVGDSKAASAPAESKTPPSSSPPERSSPPSATKPATAPKTGARPPVDPPPGSEPATIGGPIKPAVIRPPAEEGVGDPWQREPKDPNAEEPVPTEDAVARQVQPPEVGEKPDRKKRRKTGYAQYESPQRFGVELKFGPYLPDIDRSYTGAREFGPYGQVFGDTDDNGHVIDGPNKAFMFALGFEWQFWNPGDVGPFGLGFTFSFMRDSANAIFTEYAVNPDLAPEGEPIRSTTDKVHFTSIPLALQLVYRFELLADRFRVPIVPYAKIGPAYAFWWSTGGDGSISVNSRGDRAVGGAWGFQVNAGGMLRLDFLEGESHALDRQIGINHTYVFGEFHYSQIDNFGREKSISLGDMTFFLGLAMEF